MKPPRITSLKIVQTPLPLTGESTMFNPLATQVGGQHYKNMPIQPVEFSERNQLPYCMANVIKYVSRHRAKHGREDLEKAIHYCDLGLSMYEQTKTAWRTQDSDWAITPLRFCQENKFDAPTTKAVIHLCSVFSRGSMGYLEAKQVLEDILMTDYPPLRASRRR